MMALYMPMQPSSKTPRMALRSSSFAASSSPVLAGRGRQRMWIEIAHVREIMRDSSLPDPFAQTGEEIVVLEVFAPQGVERNSRLDERAIEIEQAHQAGPLAGPIRDGEDGSAMAAHAGEYVMRVLPCGGGEDETGFGIDAGEDIHAHALAGDEAVALRGINRKGALDSNTLIVEGPSEPALQILLRRPADLIRGLAQISAGDENNLL